MKCNVCPLHLVCISGTLDMSYAHTYVCRHCERFFTKAITLALGWSCFVCERRSAYIAEYKQTVNKCNKIAKKSTNPYKHIFNNSTVTVSVFARKLWNNATAWDTKIIIRDPVTAHKSLCIKLCDTCDNALHRQYTVYTR